MSYGLNDASGDELGDSARRPSAPTPGLRKPAGAQAPGGGVQFGVGAETGTGRSSPATSSSRPAAKPVTAAANQPPSRLSNPTAAGRGKGADQFSLEAAVDEASDDLKPTAANAGSRPGSGIASVRTPGPLTRGVPGSKPALKNPGTTRSYGLVDDAAEADAGPRSPGGAALPKPLPGPLRGELGRGVAAAGGGAEHGDNGFGLYADARVQDNYKGQAVPGGLPPPRGAAGAKGPAGLPPRVMYPDDDIVGDSSPSFARYQQKADRLMGLGQAMAERQSAARQAPVELDRQADVMTRRPIAQSEEERAANVIQRHYRGHRTRRNIQQQYGYNRRRYNPNPKSVGFDMEPTFAASDPRSSQALLNQPVIDINRLPRFGVLAPPIPCQPPPTGATIEYDRETNTFVKNKGSLRRALEAKTGWLEGKAVRDWCNFTMRQKARHVPVQPDTHRRALPESKGYRLRILRVSDLPLGTTADGRSLEIQLGVSLYDEAYGTFYGNTVYSQADAYDRGVAQQRNAADLDFSFDVYWHSKISDPRCQAVVEVILVERMPDGVVRGRYSFGWATLPLFKVTGHGPNGLLLDEGPQAPQSVPLVYGTPRYLTFRNVFNEQLRPPKVVPNCSLTFQAEQYPAMDAYIPLLPEDFLVSYSDVLPGLRRFLPSGTQHTSTKTVISTLASPMLSPTYSVVLRRLQLALPSRLHTTLMALDPRHVQPIAAQLHTDASMPQGQLPHIPDGPITGMYYTIRVSVHNGRTFVGPSCELQQLVHLDVPGWKVLQVPAPDPVFDYVMGDVMTTIVVELLATPPQERYEGKAPAQVLVGFTAFVPFARIAADGSDAEVAVGVHRYELRPPKKGLLLRDVPALDWRQLMGDSVNHSIAEPLVEFQLFETGRTPILPPLHSRFMVIEKQREEELALGEQPLDQLLQPVRVPAEILPPPEDAEFLAPPLLPAGDAFAADHLPHGVFVDPATTPGVGGQLLDITGAMAAQLEQLTRAVQELKDERKSLRNSFLALNDRPLADGAGMARGSFLADGFRARPGRPQQIPEDLQRLADMPTTDAYGAAAPFSGAQAAEGRGVGTAPSRMLMQHLHDAGMIEALPADVQALLRARGIPRGPSMSPIDLTTEARDARTASDIVVQFLAYRHHDTLNAPTNVQSLYFTFQLYHFPPTTTDMAYLVGTGAGPDDATASASILVSNHPMKKGAGIVTKYVVDGTLQPLATGQTAQQAAYEQSLAFAQYLAHKTLHVDVWDGESLLQMGTAAIDLQSLLRQGRDFAEQLVEVPILDQSSVAADMQGTGFASAPLAGVNEHKQATILSKGSLIVRLINIGKPPANPGAANGDDLGAARRGSKKTKRVKAAWDVVGGAIAKELADDGTGYAARAGLPSVSSNMEGYLPEADIHNPGSRMVPRHAPVGTPSDVMASRNGLADPRSSAVAAHAVAVEAQDVKLRILENSHRKSARVVQYNSMVALEGQEDKGDLQAGDRDDQFRRVQKQLLSDVASARGRLKHDFIMDQLRQGMVVSRTVRPAYGEVLVYEYEFQNPYPQDQVFELRISSPKELSLVARMDDYRALRAANARSVGSVSQPVGHLEQELTSGNRLYMQAGEKVTLPFRLQSFEPPDAYKQSMHAPDGSLNRISAPGQPGSSDTDAATRAAAAAVAGHTITVELVSVAHDHPVTILELRVAPAPIIIDRTFRFYHPERALLRQTIKMHALSGAEVTYAGGALRSLAVGCSHPDVITGAGSSGLAGGSGERDEVYIKYKCGGAPEVQHFYMLMYLDRLMARPVEVWQVFVHALRKVDMRAMIGQTSQASVVVRGAMSSRRVAAYSSHPDELQVSPDAFVLVAGALTEVLLSFRPVAVGAKEIKVHLVDSETRELVYALIVCAEAQGPLITRTFEIEMPAGTVANKKITYTNPYPTFRTFTLRCNAPWLVTFTPPRLQMPGGATRPVGITFDARAATTGVVDVLVFVNDDEDKTEECFKIRARVYR